MNFKCITCSACLSLVVLCGGIAPVQADFITFGNGAGSKWGDRQFGTSSGVITWSFMSEGTTLSAAHPLIGEISGGTGAGSSLNGLRSAFDGVYGASSFDSAIQNAFNTWSAASPGRIEFQHVADNGAVAGDPSLPASSAIDIRIGGFHSLAGSGFSFVGAVGYGPPGDAINFPDPVAGDILINLDSLFRIASNPFFDYMLDRIEEGLAPAALPKDTDYSYIPATDSDEQLLQQLLEADPANNSTP